MGMVWGEWQHQAHPEHVLLLGCDPMDAPLQLARVQSLLLLLPSDVIGPPLCSGQHHHPLSLLQPPLPCDFLQATLPCSAHPSLLRNFLRPTPDFKPSVCNVMQTHLALKFSRETIVGHRVNAASWYILISSCAVGHAWC